MKTFETLIKEIKELVATEHNDMELGRKVRAFFHKWL
jgi:hypothetical protein